MMDFLKSQLLLVVVGVGVVGSGTGWMAKSQFQGREVFLLETKLSDCEMNKVESNTFGSKEDQYRELIDKRLEGRSATVPKGEGW